MGLSPGARLGPYEIASPLGAGGMGEVYRAKDSRLNRTVAIKVLPNESASDADRRERFEREAKAISALDHPNICALYDVGEHEGTYFLVMPCLEGQTLQDRLATGALPVDQAIKIAIEIATALDAAHRHGIVHRDLKPGNVMLTKTGVKLLDFGLAKLKKVEGPLGETTMAKGTGVGTLLGTMPYMSPEQIEGRDVDTRSDIFSLGAVIYEMVTCERAFKGETAASVIGAILKDEPAPLTKVQPLAPAALEHVITTCLAKEPEERWQSAADIARSLKWAADPAEHVRTPLASGGTRLSWSVGGAIIGAILAVGLPPLLTPPGDSEPSAPVRFAVSAPAPATFYTNHSSIPSIQLALSPSGRRIAFVASGSNGRPSLWLRTFENMAPQLLPGTDDASHPFWSPDSRSIGFFAEGKLKRIEVESGLVQTICDATMLPRGGNWGTSGVIVFGATSNAGLSKVSAAGGSVSPATSLQAGENSHRWPFFLPDGRHFVFYVRGEGERRGVHIASIDDSTSTRVLDTMFNATHTPGYLLTVKDDVLLAHPFDERQLRVIGEPIRIAESVGGSAQQTASFSITDDVLAYAHGLRVESELVWFDRAGRRLGSPTPSGDFMSFRLSPDDSRLATARVDTPTSTSDIWITELGRGVERRGVEARVTLDRLNDLAPVWSPDGRHIWFRSDRTGGNYLFRTTASGAARDELMHRREVAFPTDVSPDGRYLLYHTPLAQSNYDVAALPIDGGEPIPIAQTPFMESHGRFSRDGRWIAYESDESGRMEVYVKPFPPDDNRWTVTSGGGGEPRWSRDGKELFYIAADRRLMSVTIDTTRGFSWSAVRALFATGVPFINNTFRTNYEVSGDGQRFLINTLVEGSPPPAISVVMNWKAQLR